MYTKERLLQHRRPSDVHYGVADYFPGPWPSVVKTGQHAGLAECLDCGAPMMRLVYRESEVYTCLCMHCGAAHRYHATSWKEAVDTYNRVKPKAYQIMRHMLGLDHHLHAYRNRYSGELGLSDDDYDGIKNFVATYISNGYPGAYVTPEGLRFMGWDSSDDEYRKITW